MEYGLDFDARSDFYALGCILYEAITGQMAFHRPIPLESLIAHVTGEIPNVDDHCDQVPRSLSVLVTQLMAKKAEERPASALQVLARLRDAGVTCSTADLPNARPHIYPSALVGRTPILRHGTEALREASKNRARFLALGGKSGVGKSRLAAELVRESRGRQMEVLVGHRTVNQGDGVSPKRGTALGLFARILVTIAQSLSLIHI